MLRRLLCAFGLCPAVVVEAYSNRTHRWRCVKCGHEWDD